MRDIPLPPTWFEIDKYAPAVSLDFRGWATQIGNRFYLDTLLDAGKPDEFDQLFTRIQANPFDDLGYRVPSNKAVFPLTFGIAKAIVEVLSDSKCKEKDICDEMLNQYDQGINRGQGEIFVDPQVSDSEIRPKIFSRQAHLVVNLQASEGEIHQHFENWLNVAIRKDRVQHRRDRDYALKELMLSKWSPDKHPILPLQDLRLWFKRKGDQMPSDSIMASWLRIIGDKDTVRLMRGNAKQIFSIQYCHDLTHAAASHFVPLPPKIT